MEGAPGGAFAALAPLDAPALHLRRARRSRRGRGSPVHSPAGASDAGLPSEHRADGAAGYGFDYDDGGTGAPCRAEEANHADGAGLAGLELPLRHAAGPPSASAHPDDVGGRPCTPLPAAANGLLHAAAVREAAGVTASSRSRSCRHDAAAGSTPRMAEWEELHSTSASSSDFGPLNLSPLHHLLEELRLGEPAGSSVPEGEDQRRQRVYNTMFHLIDVGFLVCLDSFLSLFTVLPARLAYTVWRRLMTGKDSCRLQADELSDLGCLLVLVLGVALLHQADVSFIYHWIRGQAFIKLYVIFNVLEIVDKLCQSFGSDVLQLRIGLRCLKKGVPRDTTKDCSFHAFLDYIVLLHALIIMSQAITLNVAINSHNNALLTLLVSNNFAEVKSNVFKRLSKDNLHKMAYLDTVERFHVVLHLVFVLVQNMCKAEEPWLLDLTMNAAMVILCEVIVDIVKHSFLARFNEVKPAAYSEFLESLCRQTLQSRSQRIHQTMQFVPLSPACAVRPSASLASVGSDACVLARCFVFALSDVCVPGSACPGARTGGPLPDACGAREQVMRVASPLLLSAVAGRQGAWRWACGCALLAVSFGALSAAKLGVGLALRAHAYWYVRRQEALQLIDESLDGGHEDKALALARALQVAEGGLRGFGTASQVPQRAYTLEELRLNKIETSRFLAPVDSTLGGVKRNLQLAGLAGLLALWQGLHLDQLQLLGIAVPILFLGTADQIAFGGGVEALILDTLGRVLSPNYKERVAQHEAGHFLVSYLLGILPKGYTLSSLDALRRYAALNVQAGTQFVDTDFQKEVNSGQLTSSMLDKFACVALAGVATEYLVYNTAEGGLADVMQLDSIMKGLGFTQKKADAQVRWAILNTVTLLRRHRNVHQKLVQAMTAAITFHPFLPRTQYSVL
eukprot:SM000131S26694  [mRNA]  locus=s131:68259:74535:- [translate_table: standard]